MAKTYHDADADLSLIQAKKVAIIGYGSQGHAHALNLKDSGVKVVVGLREDSESVAKAREQGLEVLPVVEAASRGDVVMILLPDERHHDIWEQEIRDGIAEGNMILFGHGFSIHYNEIEQIKRSLAERFAPYTAADGTLAIPARTLLARASA